MGVHLLGVLWRSWYNLWDLGLSFHHVDPGDGTQVVQLGGRLLYLDFMCVSVFIMGSAH